MPRRMILRAAGMSGRIKAEISFLGVCFKSNTVITTAENTLAPNVAIATPRVSIFIIYIVNAFPATLRMFAAIIILSGRAVFPCARNTAAAALYMPRKGSEKAIISKYTVAWRRTSGARSPKKTVYNKRLKQKGCGTKHHAGNRKQKKGLHCRCRAFLFLHVAYVLPHNNSATHCKGGEKAVEKGYDKVHERYARHGGFANA